MIPDLIPDGYDMLFYAALLVVYVACTGRDFTGWGTLFVFVSVFAWRYWRRAK